MAGPEQRTHYQVLGVPRSASTQEIRTSYRQLAYLLHPDRQGGGSPAEQRLAERRMREVNAAWTTLSDPAKRRDYDRTLVGATTSSAGGGSGAAAGGGAAAAGRPTPNRTGRPEDDEDPDAALARARFAELDPDEPELSAPQFWLLRRGPIVAVLLVGVVLFFVTAYAGTGRNDTPGRTTVPPVAAGANCIQRQDTPPMAYTVSCEGENDGAIVKHVTSVQECTSEGLEYALVANEYVCVRKSS